MPQVRLLGNIDWFNTKRGFGVICGDDAVSYFVHRTNVTSGLLRSGMRVSFLARPRPRGKNGLEAYEVQPAPESSEAGIEARDVQPASRELTGVLDYNHPGTGYVRIRGVDEGVYRFWAYGPKGTGSLKEGQEALRVFLSTVRLDQQTLWPLVAFEPEVRTRIARSVHWQGEGKTVLAVLHGDGCIVLDEMQCRSMMCWCPTGLGHPLLEGQVYYLAAKPDAPAMWRIFVATQILCCSQDDLNLSWSQDGPRRKDVQVLLTDDLHDPEIVRSLAQTAYQIMRENAWDTLEQTLLARLNPSLAEALREKVLHLMDRSELRAAWHHSPNQALLRRLAPDQVQQWLCEEVLDQMLAELKVAAIDVEVEHGKIREIGACDSQGKTQRWQKGFEKAVQTLSGDTSISLLVGHDVAWDLEHLERLQPDSPIVKLPVIDTLVLEAILRPCNRRLLHPERPGGADKVARDVLQLLRQQMIALARLPEEQLVRWAGLAGPGLGQLLAQVVSHRDHLAAFPQSILPDDEFGPKKSLLQSDYLPVEQLGDFIRALPDDEHVLILAPRSLLPFAADCDHTAIRDPYGHYIGEPDRAQVAHLLQGEKGIGTPAGDLLVYTSAFAREVKTRHRSPHLDCMADWARNLIESDPSLLASIRLAYSRVHDTLGQDQTMRVIVPWDVALRNQKLMERLSAEAFDRVVWVCPEVATRESKMSVRCKEPPWPIRRRLMPHGDRWIAGLSEQDMERWWKPLPSGWRSWLAKTFDGGWEMHVIPKSLEECLQESRSPDTPRTTFILGDAGEWIRVCRFKDQLWLTPATPYRAEYLGQVAGLVAPLARQKRVLLIMRSQEEVSRLLQTLAREQNICVPCGTLFTQMERLIRNGSGLAITREDQLIGYVLHAQAHGLYQPFDIVVVEAWPVDMPEWIPPPICDGFERLGFSPGQPEQATEHEEETGLDDDDPGQTEEEDQALSDQDSAPSLSSILCERLKEHSNVLAPFVWAAERLSGQPLLILDSRLSPDLVRDIGRFTVQPLDVDFDDMVASRIRQQLAAQDRLNLWRRSAGKGVPPKEEWSGIARQLFDLPGDLYPWQETDLERIMLQQHRTLTVEAVTGGGKSIVYQFPALVQGAHNHLLTVVISPLRALMHEQCHKLWQRGFRFVAEAVSSDLARGEVDEIYQRLADGQIQLLFVAPERFRSRRFRQALEERLRRDQRLQYWVFDEAHCISLWGHDFRPDYFYAAQEAQRLRMQFSDAVAPVLLLSATLPTQVVRELEEIFERGNPPS